MRFSLKSLFVVVTLASMFMGAVSMLQFATAQVGRSEIFFIALFVVFCIPMSSVGALIGKAFSRADVGFVFGVLAAFLGTVAVGMWLSTLD